MGRSLAEPQGANRTACILDGLVDEDENLGLIAGETVLRKEDILFAAIALAKRFG